LDDHPAHVIFEDGCIPQDNPQPDVINAIFDGRGVPLAEGAIAYLLRNRPADGLPPGRRIGGCQIVQAVRLELNVAGRACNTHDAE
jgi:hypothetical protein